MTAKLIIIKDLAAKYPPRGGYEAVTKLAEDHSVGLLPTSRLIVPNPALDE